MKITPLEIRQKTFEKAFRGLDKDEVNAFLLTLSQQWEKLQDENKELRFKLESTTKEVQKMREVESTLYRTLKTAEDTGNNMVEQATKEATLQLREAQLKSEQLLNDARLKARNLIEDAYSQSDKAVTEMQHEVKALEQEHQRLESYLDNLLRDLSNLANDALEKVEKNKSKPRPALSSILAQAANIKVKREDLGKVYQDVPSTASTNGIGEKKINFDKATGNSPVDIKAIGDPVQPIQPIQPIQPEVPSPDYEPYQPSKPEIPRTPQTPVPDVPAPEIERPSPDIPEIQPDRVEQPIPDIQPVTPDTPEIQPPATQPGFNQTTRPALVREREREKAPAGGSFFDDFD